VPARWEWDPERRWRLPGHRVPAAVRVGRRAVPASVMCREA
jgi:hypothetical protein